MCVDSEINSVKYVGCNIIAFDGAALENNKFFYIRLTKLKKWRGCHIKRKKIGYGKLGATHFGSGRLLRRSSGFARCRKKNRFFNPNIMTILCENSISSQLFRACLFPCRLDNPGHVVRFLFCYPVEKNIPLYFVYRRACKIKRVCMY